MIGREFTSIRNASVCITVARYVFLTWMSCLLFLHSDANAQNAGNTGVCDRTQQVQDEIIERIGAVDCSYVTDHALSTITRLDFFERYVGSGLGNGLKKLKADDFNGLGNLQELFFWRRYSQLTELPEGIFNGLENLRELRLEDNQLAELPEGIFNGLENLQWLNLDANRLTNLPEGIFNGLSSLQELNITENQLTVLPEGIFSGLRRLQRLRISENQLTNLPEGIFNGLSSLQELYIAENQLTRLPEGIFGGLENMQILHLQNNGLETISRGIFNSLRSLQYLALGGNSLRTLPTKVFSRQSHLEELYLDGNQFSELSADMFSGLDNLRSLDISGNQLKILPENIIDGLKNLRELHSYNDPGDAESIAYSRDIFYNPWGGYDWSEDRNDMPPHPYAYRVLFLRHDIVLCEKDVRIELLRLYRDILSRTSPRYYIYIYAFYSLESTPGWDALEGALEDALEPEEQHGTGLSKYVGENGIVVLSWIPYHAAYNDHAIVLLAKNPDKASPEIIFRPSEIIIYCRNSID